MDPADPTGRCHANYTLRREGKEVFARTLHFTMTSAVVSDQGLTLGVHNPFAGDRPAEKRELLVAILDAEGKLRHEKKYEIRPGFGPALCFLGLHVQNQLGRGIMRVKDRGGKDTHEYWWVYDLEKGKRGSTFSVETRFAKRRAAGSVKRIEELPGTPLLLVHWEKRPASSKGEGLFEFALLDERWRVLWECDAEEHDEIRSITATGEFVIHDRSAELLIQLQAAQNGKRWKASEISRESFKDSNPPPEVPKPQRRGP